MQHPASADALARLNAALAGRYDIESELGSGGMATVYLANDVKHDRKVALKVLKPELAAMLGADRFVVEIKTTANLQHPHILPLFDSGNADGFLYYVMPWVQGEALRAKLDRETQLGVDDAVQIAREVADALEYAHQRGVVHRDIKPENILLHGGHAMVVDFGIALAVSAAAGGRMTESGLSLGTPHYMSPEQATAQKEISARSDVYSLGAVLYEMLTGNPPHTGASPQQIIMKIIAEPVEPVAKYRKSVPANVAAAVMKAVEPLAADRFDSAKAFADALRNPEFTTTDAARVRARGAAQRGRLSIASWAAALLATLTGGYALGRQAKGAPDAVPARFSVELPDSLTSVFRAGGPSQALSPDASILVFVGMSGSRGALYKRSLGRFGAEMIPGTEEGGAPFFSPDGQWLGFLAAGELRKMPVAGGPVTPIATTGMINGASWGDDDVIVYTRSADRQLYRVSASGGKPAAVTASDSSTAYYAPSVLPGAKWVLVGTRKLTQTSDMAHIAAVELSTGRVDTIRSGVYARYANGALVIGGADNTLLVQPFDPSRRKTTGTAIVILNDVAMRAMHGSEFSVSTNGWLEYEVTPAKKKVLRVWGPGGQGLVTLPGHSGDDVGDPAISPDGRRIALRLVPAGAGPRVQGDIWILDRQQGTLTRFTTGGGGVPTWSPDGRRIAYWVQDDTVVKAGLYIRPADQTGPAQLVRAGRNYPASWLQDGHSLTFIYGGPNWDSGIITLGDSTPRWIARTASNEGYPMVSPDGRRIAFNSDRAGPFEVYVQAVAGEGAPVQVSSDGGSRPRWSPDGHTLFYVSGKSMIAATLAPGTGIAVVSRKVVADVSAADMRGQHVNWDIFPDGKQFLWVEPGAGGGPRIALVQNWMEMARALSAKK